MKSTNLILLQVMLIALLGSCSRDNDALQEQKSALETDPYDRVTFLNSANQNRIKLPNTILDIVPFEGKTTYSKAKNKFAFTKSTTGSITNKHSWKMVADLKAPSAPEGITGNLSASHCAITEDDFAFVSYHKQGKFHYGLLEIIDIQDPKKPKILNTVLFRDSDINAIKAASCNEVWLAASNVKHGALVYKLNTKTKSLKRINLSNSLPTKKISASANGIALTNDYVLVSSGKTNGGTFVIDRKTDKVVYADSFSNAKYVAVNDDCSDAIYATIATGNKAEIKMNAVNSFTRPSSFSIGNAIHQNVEMTYKGKNTITFNPYNDKQLFCSMGKAGLHLFDVTKKQLTSISPSEMIKKGNTNGVSFDPQYIYIANGADGMAISGHVFEDGDKITPIFTWDSEDSYASVNYIEAAGSYVYICNGQGGFHILERTRNK